MYRYVYVHPYINLNDEEIHNEVNLRMSKILIELYYFINC